ncbi:hypothetical protein ACFVH0_15880 [Streptomyces sp. NPDC127117]|uniref:hypothetical protein n=1 Tax=Streptomyces sp. NPDC127117 TaxID=3345368 RepID=UPI00362A95A7
MNVESQDSLRTFADAERNGELGGGYVLHAGRLTDAHAGETEAGSPTLIRYADDLVALRHSRDEAEQVKARLAAWLMPGGPVYNFVVPRYFGWFNRSRQDRWVFGDRETDPCLTKSAWTKTVRHQMIPGRASVDDPALSDY